MDAPAPLDRAALGEPAIAPRAAEQVWVAVPSGESETGAVASLGVVEPTQVRRPWRATLRTAFAVLVSLCAMLPLLVSASGLDETAGPVAGALAISAGITRVLALQAVETFLQRFVPWLAAVPAR